MNRTAFTAVAMLLATGSAFAGSDHYGLGNASQPVATVDHTHTASIRVPAMVRQSVPAPMKSDADEPGRGIWGK